MLLMAGASAATAAPYRPSDEAQVLQRVPPASVSLSRSRTPASPEQAAALAQSYIERSRRDGDPRWLGYAQGLLRPWWNLPEPPAPVLLLRATLKQSQHQFEPALDDLGLLLRNDPRNAQAWLTRATVLRVLGRYTEARAACLKLIGLTDDFVPTLCATTLHGLNGGLAQALNQMQALEPASNTRPPDLRAWYWAERTEMLERHGDGPEAETAYRQAMVQAPDDLGLRAAYADFLLDHQRPAEALELVLQPAADLRADALRLRELLAQKRLGRVEPALQASIADGFAAARQRGDALHLREEARFVLEVLGDAPRALVLAQQNWTVQHEPWDVRLLLASAQAAGQPQAAVPVREWLKHTGYEDARLPANSGAAP